MPGKPTLYMALLLMLLSCSIDPVEQEQIYEEVLLDEVEIAEVEVEPELAPEALLAKDWLEGMQFPNGLMESAEETNFVSLYDNALAALAFMAIGDIEKAEAILDYFNERIESELLHGQGGFYQFRNGQGGEKRTIWLGDNAWLLIALNNYKSITGNHKYEMLSSELENWIRSLQEADGGVRGGYFEDGTPMHVITEGMVAAYNAVQGYDSFHQGILQYLKTERWNSDDRLLVAWPDNESYYYAMDLHSLSYMVFEGFPVTVLDDASRYINSQTSTLTGVSVWGYCFDEDRDVVWLEGTGQMALAYKHAHMHEQSNELVLQLTKAGLYLIQEELIIGLPYTTNNGSGYGAVELWDHADTKAAISSTVWYLFNILEFNPLETGKVKNAPIEDKFWLQ